jgi:hypothetical protein
MIEIDFMNGKDQPRQRSVCDWTGAAETPDQPEQQQLSTRRRLQPCAATALILRFHPFFDSLNVTQRLYFLGFVSILALREVHSVDSSLVPVIHGDMSNYRFVQVSE